MGKEAESTRIFVCKADGTTEAEETGSMTMGATKRIRRQRKEERRKEGTEEEMEKEWVKNGRRTEEDGQREQLRVERKDLIVGEIERKRNRRRNRERMGKET